MAAKEPRKPKVKGILHDAGGAAADEGVSASGGGPQGFAEATPSMAQFLEIKAANPDSLLWYRMGDFYELFFEDAVIASNALGIVLTKRGKHLGQDIPMCGVPIHRSDDYLQRLIRLGHRVAIAEQLEDPAEAKKRGSKSVVRRDVVRLVTPGTLTEEALLDAKARNYLTALFRTPGAEDARFALASVDISTGELEIGEVAPADITGELARLTPSEIILPDSLYGDDTLAPGLRFSRAALTPVPGPYFDSFAGERGLKSQLGVSELGGFGEFSRAELAAAGAVLKYVELTQIGKRPVLRPPKKIGSGAAMIIDASSRASLELVRSVSGEKAGSLFGAIDRTVTGPGARELASRIASPLVSADAIRARLDTVEFLVEKDALREDVRACLKVCPDLARSVSRLAFGRGGPRDLAAIRGALDVAADAARLLTSAADSIVRPTELQTIAERLRAGESGLGAKLTAALVDDPPHLRRDGGFVREGYRADLDEAVRLRDESRRIIAGLEARYIELSGVKTLKVRHNNILGFFIEVTQANAKPLLGEPLSETFRHRQTIASAVRFTTAELVEIEGRIASAGERALAIEQEVFAELSADVAREEQRLCEVAAALADLDVAAALAELAHEERYTRPVIDEAPVFDVRGGRHPVVEQALKAARTGPFIENDCRLGGAHSDGADASKSPRIWLVTGPNMAGKSTFLRQNALIAVLAQMGSFVPAQSARLGVVDRLFSRVGAADDLARGRSTFMVEMVETSAILNQATERSFVILDEIGRGTATFDGLSIAWATVEYLHDVIKARSLFATHYHEMTELAARLDHLSTVTMDVREWRDEIVFLHQVKPGAADRSYGIQVAKLAGLPKAVVNRAREVLALLEADRSAQRKDGQSLDDLPLFSAAPRPVATVAEAPAGPSALEAAVDELAPDELTPRAALEILYRLKALRQDTADATGQPAVPNGRPR
jgi:DNA mismatch repair protein MutS